MPKRLLACALVGLVSLSAAVAAAEGRRPHPPAPGEMVRVFAAGETLAVWPYTTSDFETPSDPINLVFPNADPREIRQELLKLDAGRPPFAGVPAGDCLWTDAMGYEQAAYSRPGGWVGGAVQLACVHPGFPLGDSFRFHVRLFRAGRDTVANAHFEFLVPGTAEHEVLSWDLARDFVAYDVGRTGTLVAAPEEVGMIAPGSFRAVRRPVYNALAASPAAPLLAALGLVPDGPGDVPIPTSGAARVLVAGIALQRERSTAVTTTQVTYGIVVPKPFCATGPYDFVRLEGPLQFTMSVTTLPSGRYDRTYALGGTLEVTPMAATSPTTFVVAGPTVEAPVFEIHRAWLTDHHAQVAERVEQSLHGDALQSATWSFMAGDTDRFVRELVCGAE